MFEIPDAKRIRREDLDESADSSGSEGVDGAQVRAQLESQIARSLGLDFRDVDATGASSAPSLSRPPERDEPTQNVEDDEDQEEPPEEYDFCLFAGVDSAPTKVLLEKDSEPKGEGGFIARRPLSFYLRADPSLQERERFAAAAVTGDEVLARSGWRSWSMELPWKVTHVTVNRKSGCGAKIMTTNDIDAEKRRRPCKKRRIAMRMRERAKKDKASTAVKQQEEKEEHLKDKKKRLNRARKLRRREKERERKISAQDEAGEATSSAGDSDGSG